jgi:molybdopterin-guanine dinucleotide biosynthesis protein A
MPFLYQQFTAIILAGGKSSRLGREKSMLDYEGKPLIAHIAAQLTPIFNEVLIGANEPQKYDFLGLPIIADMKPDLGPLMGIASTVAHARNLHCFVIGCDIPTVDYAFLHRLLSGAANFDIVVPRSSDGNFEPLFAAYGKGMVAPALELLRSGGRRIADLYDKVRTDFVSFEPGDWYKNINTLHDYNEILGSKK